MSISPAYPIGDFVRPASIASADVAGWVDQIERLPSELRAAVHALPPGAIDRPYREGGWTGRQVVHHVADSHMNSYVRFRLGLTEESPTIKPYEEALWAMLPDAARGEVEVSLALLDALHSRWTVLLRAMTAAQWARTVVHPASGIWTLGEFAALYSWHGRHHVAHVRRLLAGE